jgi:hypothetical protein
MAINARLRRATAGVLAFLLIGIAGAMGRGESASAIGAFALAVVTGGGLVIAVFALARTKN